MAEEFEDIESGSSINPLVILGVLFFPAYIINSAFYALFRYGKFKVSFITFIAGITSILTLLIGGIAYFVTEPFPSIPSIIIAYLVVCILIGSWAGVFKVRKLMKELEADPSQLEIPGTWSHKLKLKQTPWEKKAVKKRIEQLRSGVLIEEDRAPLGLDESNDDNDVVYRYDDEAVKHLLVTGASGSGKSITMLSMIRKNILVGQPVIVIDMKRSAEMASKLANWTKEAGGEFYHFVNGEPEDYDVKDSPGQVLYDPLSGGTPGSNADMILGMREYDQASEHYKTNMQQVLQILFKMLFFGKKEIATRLRNQQKAKQILQTNPPKDLKKLAQLRKIAESDEILQKALELDWNGGGLYLLASALKPANLTYLEALVKNTEVGIDASEMMAMVREKQTNPIKHAIQELQGQLRTITSSEYGKWLQTKKGHRSLNIFELTQKPGTVILFSLNSDSEPEFAKFIGSIILSDITNVSAKRRNNGLKNLVSVYVDEFQAVPPTSVTSLLEKARESRIAMTLAQQSFEQIVSSAQFNGQAYLGSILDTCSNFIVHAGSIDSTAQILAGIVGKDKKLKYTALEKGSRKSGRGKQYQVKEETDWNFDPSEFMKLTLPDKTNNYKSTAVVINKTSSDEKFAGKAGAVARRVWMIPDDKVIAEYYIPTFKDSALVHEDIFEDFNEVILEEEDSEEFFINDTLNHANNARQELEDEEGGFGFETTGDVEEPEEDDYGLDPSLDYDFEAPTSAASLFKGQGLKPQVRQKDSKNVSMPEINQSGGFSLPDL